MLKNKPNAKIAILYQNDDYGKDVLKGVKDGLGATGAKMIVARGDLRGHRPDRRLADPHAAGLGRRHLHQHHARRSSRAQAIRKAYDSGWKPLHFLNNVGASVGSVLTPAGLDKSVGLITVQYYKDPNDPQWKDDPAMLEWRGFMGKLLHATATRTTRATCTATSRRRRWCRCSSSAATT